MSGGAYLRLTAMVACPHGGRAAYSGKKLWFEALHRQPIDNALKYGQNALCTLMTMKVRLSCPSMMKGRAWRSSGWSRCSSALQVGGQQQGYGLGLGIARNIAHSHGVRVTLQNRVRGVAGNVQLPGRWIEDQKIAAFGSSYTDPCRSCRRLRSFSCTDQ